MGGKPSRQTPADKRLKANKPGQMMDEKPLKTSRPTPVMTKLVKGGKRK